MATRSALLTLLLVLTACGPNASSRSAAEKATSGHVHALASAGPCAAGSTPPLGALPPELPVWCSTLSEGIDTAVKGSNTWMDPFGSTEQHARLAPSYKFFEAPGADHSSVYRSQHF